MYLEARFPQLGAGGFGRGEVKPATRAVRAMEGLEQRSSSVLSENCCYSILWTSSRGGIGIDRSDNPLAFRSKEGMENEGVLLEVVE